MANRPMDQGNYRGMPSQQESTSLIDQYSNFDGTYNSARDLRVEGKVTGTIVCRGTLHVAQGATVRASVEAEAISVAGELEGEIECRGRLELLPSGRAKGRISTQSIIIHEGAVYEGDLEMGNNAARSRRARASEKEPDSPVVESATAASEAETVDVSVDAEAITAPTSTEEAAPVSRPSSFIRRFGTQDSPLTPEATDE